MEGGDAHSTVTLCRSSSRFQALRFASDCVGVGAAWIPVQRRCLLCTVNSIFYCMEWRVISVLLNLFASSSSSSSSRLYNRRSVCGAWRAILTPHGHRCVNWRYEWNGTSIESEFQSKARRGGGGGLRWYCGCWCEYEPPIRFGGFREGKRRGGSVSGICNRRFTRDEMRRGAGNKSSHHAS